MEVELSKSECFEQLRYREIHISRVHCRHSDTSQQFLLSSIQLSVLSNPKFIVPASSDTRDETRQSPCEPSSCRHHNDDDNIPLPTHPPPPHPRNSKCSSEIQPPKSWTESRENLRDNPHISMVISSIVSSSIPPILKTLKNSRKT